MKDSCTASHCFGLDVESPPKSRFLIAYRDLSGEIPPVIVSGETFGDKKVFRAIVGRPRILRSLFAASCGALGVPIFASRANLRAASL